ncbi:MAG TPA: Clp protease N-terminal domain-containing protein [Solirubrobacteraceae bacterium]|jgi:ATP-dependent Clp protease ATP-binding subunit ClpA|nr:Clp protease N-terminal domain-containing protein [Solirubrobacteraceae bacterium]
MFERFTEGAREVVVLAQDTARQLNHQSIGTEHILLGLLREGEGIAAEVLAARDVTLERVRAQVVEIVGAGEESTGTQIPFTPRAKKVLELSLRESLSLGHNYIGPEHILLGIARENTGVASRILLDFGVDAEKIRHEVSRLLATSQRSGRVDQVVQLARVQARELKHNELGTAHLLLGLLGQEEGIATRVLASLDVTLERVRAQVVRIVGASEEDSPGQIPFTPRAKKVLEWSLRESLSLGHNYIGSEHILLGIARENTGVASRILLDFGVDAEKIRHEVARLLADPATPATA